MTNVADLERVRAGLDAAGLTGQWVSAACPEAISRRTGAYLLAIRLVQPLPIELRRLKAATLSPGLYLYAGSAYGPGGMAARLARHFRKDKPVHWHVDRLTVAADGLAALAIEGGDECRLVAQLLETGWCGTALDGFGSTDCRTCPSHLLAASP